MDDRSTEERPTQSTSNARSSADRRRATDSLLTQLRAKARRSSAPWDDEALIRAPRFSDDQFALHARSLADTHVVIRRAQPVISLLTRLEDNEKVLSQCYDAVMAAVDDDATISPAAEWFIDNFHQIEKQIQIIQKDLPRGYFKLLPKLGPGFLEGHPRIFAIMWAYVAHTDSHLDPDQLAAYIRAYDARAALEIGELWAVAINLRFLLVENARRLAVRIVAAGRERATADEHADALLGIGTDSPAPLDSVVPDWRTTQPSIPYAVQLTRRLAEAPVGDAVGWITESLESHGLDTELAVQQELALQSAGTLTMRNIVHSLRAVDDVDWEEWLESVSTVEAELRRSPGYSAADFATRNRYRSTIERLARGSRHDERTVARRALSFAAEGFDDVGQHVGYWLIDDGLPLLEKAVGYRPPLRERVIRAFQRSGVAGYLSTVVLLTLVLTALATWGMTAWARLDLWQSLILGLVALAPVSDFVVARVASRLTHLIPTDPLPALRLAGGVPERFRTLVVVPTMITSEGAVAETLETLETHFLANDHGEIYFAAATDWADSDEQESPEDRALLDAVREGVSNLNDTYGDRFLLFHRERRYNPAEGVWMGWERKRGKLDELNRVLRGETGTSITTIEGHLPGPFRYVITLDADTRLPLDSARQMVGKLAHPLNAAHFEPGARRPVRGYTILQPRVTPSLPSTEKTSLFQAIYTTRQGLDPYAFAVADLYQDLFAEGSFAGKGIYDIDALHRALNGRIPENTVLSHDLLEGNYSRSGFMSDVEVVEEHPTSYAVHISRTHRWTRGDWQLLPWMFGKRREGITALGQWKMLDNLRRSLSPVLEVLAIIVGAAILPPGPLAGWIVGIMALHLLPLVIPALRGALHLPPGVEWTSHLRASGRDIIHALRVAMLNFSFLAHQAAEMVDAIVRTLWRLTVSRKHMLEWTTAAAASRSAKGGLPWFLKKMRWGFVAPALLALVAGLNGWAPLAVSVPVILLWLAAPVMAWDISRPIDPVATRVSPEVARGLRTVARRTWRFFETFVTPEDSDLPPDNFQEDPEGRIAHRTSPTNIGMYYLSTVAARDLGWIGLTDATERMVATMRTQIRLDRYRGHLYNWYDTQTTLPLQPRYVSSVDSGNLAGHLIALANACVDLAKLDPRADGVRTGVHDALDCLAETPASVVLDLTAVRAAVDAVPAPRTDGPVAAEAARPAPEAETAAWQQVLHALAGVRAQLGPADAAASDWIRAVEGSVHSRLRDLALNPDEIAHLRMRLAWLEAEARREVEVMDFSFLIDTRRELLSIGYDTAAGELDESTYDMMASECRLASFVAIAKGDVPRRHWGRLGRGLTNAGGGATMLSWSGSMFEYLMPYLVMRAPARSMLSTTMERVVTRQQEYGAERHVPWGISESAFNARDRELNYQYSPFGVPGLGVVRGLANNLVVAPYATGLAAQIDPDGALANFGALRQIGAWGQYGPYEAVDFTSERVPRGERHAVVRNYMAHHSGMLLVAIHNVLTDGAMREWFHAEPMVRATELLLHEAAPRVAPRVHARTEELDPKRARKVRAVTAPIDRSMTDTELHRRQLAAFSNGTLSLTATASGATHLRWNGLSITRWSPDLTTDASGAALTVRTSTGTDLTPTLYPSFGDTRSLSALFSEDAATFSRHGRTADVHVEHRVSPVADAYVQTLTVRNHSRSTLDVDVTSLSELALHRRGDDDAHPAFSKMFVYTYATDDGMLVATRRKRSSSDPDVWIAQFVTGPDEADAAGPTGPTLLDSDGRSLIGRGRSMRNPAVLDPGAAPQGRMGYLMEPVTALRTHLEVPAEGKATAHVWTVVGRTEEEVLRLVDSHRARGTVERLRHLAWTTAQGQLRFLGITPSEAAQFQALAGAVTFPDPAMRAPAEALADAGSQRDLWALGISGDLPILAVRIDDEADIDLVRQTIRAFEYWRLRRIAVDVVFVAEARDGYIGELPRRLEELAAAIHQRTGNPDSTGRVFVVRSDQADPNALRALWGAAAVVLVARRGSLADQLRFSKPMADVAPPAPTLPRAPLALPDGVESNGFGGFSADGREYVIATDDAHPTPSPWTNVVANATFGFHATAEGAGYTWAGNSRDNQVTPWRNDVIRTPVSEVLYVRDRATGTLASLGSAPVPGGAHLTRHGFGYTTYELDVDGVHCDQTMFVPLEGDAKLSIVRVRNESGSPRSLRFAWYGEVVLGNNHAAAARHVLTSLDASGALVAENPWSHAAPGQVAFVDMGRTQTSWTGNRTEFLGRHGTPAAPAALATDALLSGTVGDGDPCLAMTRDVTLDAGEETEFVIMLGTAPSRAAVGEAVEGLRAVDVHAELAAVRAHWERLLGQVQVSTPDRSFDLMLNGWLLYQTIACRMTARSGYYQASGAYGFRDQLQDSMTAVLVDPAAARQHLLTAAGRQFPEGDVQHWWLPGTGEGIRTRITDDVVWLAYVTSHYLRVTGDISVLDEQVPFLEGALLEDGEAERFFRPEQSERTASLYEHCLIALRRAMSYGFHGLPLMGTGDWNDGMNRVGAGGQGESVWLGWFLVTTLDLFGEIAAARGDENVVRELADERERVVAALEAEGWDGEWYRRGYFDDGTPLGSAQRPECRIDAIAQSWAVLSGRADQNRVRMAMNAVQRELLSERDKILRLFWPPFDTSEPDPGYIRAYPPGVRENGGQYTHGSLWSIFAWARLGDADLAHHVFSMMNPVNHSLDPASAESYSVEPYVVAADVYSVEPFAGKGGWTWYTGSAGWMYRAGLEAVLGIVRAGDTLEITPRLPSAWPGAEVRIRHGAAATTVVLRRSEGVTRVVRDGVEIPALDGGVMAVVPLVDDGATHRVEVWCP